MILIKFSLKYFAVKLMRNASPGFNPFGAGVVIDLISPGSAGFTGGYSH
jgi:hypothetical protein